MAVFDGVRKVIVKERSLFVLHCDDVGRIKDVEGVVAIRGKSKSGERRRGGEKRITAVVKGDAQNTFVHPFCHQSVVS